MRQTTNTRNANKRQHTRSVCATCPASPVRTRERKRGDSGATATLGDTQPWGQCEAQQTPGGQCGRTLRSGRTVCGTPKLHRCIPLPAERLPGPHPQGSSRDVYAHVHTCACALGGVRWAGSQGRVPEERILGPHPQEPSLSFSRMRCQESPSMRWLK